MTCDLVVGESLQVFDQNNQDRGTENNANYDLVIKYLINQFFSSKALHRQKRYLRRGLYKSHDTKIQDFIRMIDNMVEYLENFLPSGINQGLTEDDILDLVEFFLPRELHKELANQGFDSMTQGITELVKLCDILETSEEIFQAQG